MASGGCHSLEWGAAVRRWRGRVAVALSSRTAFAAERRYSVGEIVDREPGPVTNAGDARTASVFLPPGSGTAAGKDLECMVDRQRLPAHRRGRHTVRLVLRSGKIDH